MPTDDIELRPHQKQAVTAVARALRTGARASVVAACGTGKTLIAARSATRLVPCGRVLVLVPTLDLLAQTAQVWRAAGRRGPAVAVCSARQALDHDPVGGDTPMTTSAQELAARLPADLTGQVTVYATYASLHAVACAHRAFDLPAWDLVIVDDADAWLRFDHPVRAEEIALALSLRVLAPKSAEWRRGLAAARRYHQAHHHLDVPQNFEDTDRYPLGRWLTWQRRLHATGALDAARAAALERLGVVWDPRRQAWDRGHAHAAAWAGAHGHLTVPVDEQHDGFALGRWLATQRSRSRRLTPGRVAALAALDPWWNPPWPLTWQRTYRAVQRHLEGGHDVNGGTTAPGQDAEGARLERWLRVQRARPERLDPRQRQLLDGIGTPGTPAPEPAAGSQPRRRRTFEEMLVVAAAFRAREGHLDVPQRHTEPIEPTEHTGHTGQKGGTAEAPVRLGRWISNQRRRRAALPPERVAALDALGMHWNPAEGAPPAH